MLVTCLLAVAKDPKKQLKEANFRRLTLQGHTVHHGEKTEHEAAAHTASAVRKQ